MDTLGGIFFIQDRPRSGGGKSTFKIIKFSTMVKNAIQKGGGKGAFKDDPRITPVGFWLRKYSLDELPQLFNVVKGDMNIVGFRPLLLKYVTQFPAEFLIQYQFLPGLTGLAQIKALAAIPLLVRFKYDLQCVEDFFLSLDLKILIKTFIVVINSKGLCCREISPKDKT